MDFVYDASQVHFRAALDSARLARLYRREAEAERAAGGSGVEPGNREADAAIVTVLLTQAAAEAYGSWVHLRAERHPGFLKWQQAWKEFPQAARALGRSGDFELDPDRAALLLYISRWRNYLMHTDPGCRVKLRDQLVQTEEINEGDGEPQIVALLNAELAERLVADFEKLFRWAQEHTGVSAPFTHGAWSRMPPTTFETPVAVRSLPAWRRALRRLWPMRK
ncbi:hypothetical protein [Actinomadura parmotrematis]|uniref:Uncharacterized protein n=1 Tax=Actinomadura parmotrematis TaxID=2864039 RepID=A0ABS7FQD6_9ACTN|nr:hypothetical protein [Actinomadura parmotrematis]MBW8482615.1 hypothetical protein [Actinomadura parmotrematis]